MYTLSEIYNLIAPHVGSLTSVKITNTGTKRGAPLGDVSGLIIYRTGAVGGSANAGTLSIVLEGGKAGWEGAISDTAVDTYYTRAQLAILDSIVRHIQIMNPNVYVEQDN